MLKTDKPHISSSHHGAGAPSSRPRPPVRRLAGQHILSAKQFDTRLVADVVRVADEMRTMVERDGRSDLLRGKVLVNFFCAESTRTRVSCEVAMKLLGGEVVTVHDVSLSSMAKGESLRHTVRVLLIYGHVMVMRHGTRGSVEGVTRGLEGKYIINAGDGDGEHPTQALLDLYTILYEFGQLNDLVVTMVGDLRFGRTIHSLARLLAMYPGIRQRFVSPAELRLPEDVRADLIQAGVMFEERETFDEALVGTDVTYATRIQKERCDEIDPDLYGRVKDFYRITPTVMQTAKSGMRLMHPLPIVDEIDDEVEKDSRAIYFKQALNGLYVRMALLAMVLGKA